MCLVTQTVKSLPAMRETRVRSLGQEDPLEKEMATHSSIIAWKIPRTEDPGGLQSMGLQRVGHDWATSLSLLSLSMFSRLFQVIACISISFLFIVESIHLAVDRHLGYFHFGATMKKAATNIHVQVFTWTYDFSSPGHTPRSGIAGPHSNSIFNILKNHQNFSQSRYSILHSHQQHEFQFLHILTKNTCYCLSFFFQLF